MSEILRKPVHVAILRESDIQRLAREGKLGQQPFSVDAPERAPLPAETKPKLTYNIPHRTDIVKQAKMRTHLRVVHNNLPPIPAEKKPPCEACKTAACCRAYVVPITKEEYEAGLYGDNAIALTDEFREQFKYASASIFPWMTTMPNVFFDQNVRYLLEGAIGEPCPFLGDDNRCKIYDIRPATCRMYTCVDDPSITQEMRDGTVDIKAAMIDRLFKSVVESS